MKKTVISVLILCACLLLSSCGKKNTASGTNNISNMSAVTEISTDDMDFEFSNKDTTYDYDESEAKTVADSEKAVKITAEGTYVVSGEHESITVSAPDTAKVRIILKNTTVSNTSGPAIYIESADKVFITACEGTVNTLSDGTSYTGDFKDTNIDGAIFSKADLTLNGEGTLNITGNCKCGVVSKDDLIICGLNLTVKSTGCALEGKDCVKIKDAAITVSAGGDGIRSTNTEKSNKGFVYIETGNIDITSGNDGIQAATVLKAANGSIKITAGGGAADTKQNSGGRNMPGFGGNTQTTDDEESTKGLKAGSLILIDEGDFEVSSKDDSFHSNGDIEINGGSFTAAAGDDGFHADNNLIINGGSITVSQSYEGLEGQKVTVTGGNIDITASDDGINAAGSSSSSSTGGRPGNSDSNALITIGGGYIVVNASGDGIDSNGNVVISGGTVLVSGPTDNGNGTFDYDGEATVSGGTLLVSGPTDNGNGAFDYGGEATVSGGTVILCGSSGMAQGFSDKSEQASFMYTLDSSASAGSSVALTDEKGNVLASFIPAKQYNNVVISTPSLKSGSSYKLLIGGTVSGADKNGFASSGSVSSAAQTLDVKLTGITTTFGSGGMSGGNMGGGNKGRFGGGQAPDMNGGAPGDTNGDNGGTPPDKPNGRMNNSQ